MKIKFKKQLTPRGRQPMHCFHVTVAPQKSQLKSDSFFPQIVKLMMKENDKEEKNRENMTRPREEIFFCRTFMFIHVCRFYY